MSVSLVTTTWSCSSTFDLLNTELYKSFKHFNPNLPVYHCHYNRYDFLKKEWEFTDRFGLKQQAEYILYKIVFLKDHLEQITTDYIIVCDANDVVCLNDVHYLLNCFDLENLVVVGTEKQQWPPKENSDSWKIFGFVDYSNFDLQNKYFLNSGMILASKKNFAKMLEQMIDIILAKNIKNFRNDQGVFVWYYTAQMQPQIKLDYENTFVVNTFGRTTEDFEFKDNKLYEKNKQTAPCFVHDNGLEHGSPKFIEHFDLKQAYSY